MSSAIDLRSILIANAMGLVILFIMLVANRWRMYSRKESDLSLKIMIVLTALACIVDPLCMYMDGRDGPIAYLCVYFGNFWLYAGNLAIGLSWIRFVTDYLGLTLSRRHRTLIVVPAAVGGVLLLFNSFYPIVFIVNMHNVYSRTMLYWYYLAFDCMILLDSVIIYYRAQFRSGKLKFFPIWAFVLPIVVGVTIQSVWYGTSTIWPFYSVSLCCAMSCLQNELVYRDKLTGLYNRYYLETLELRFCGVRDRFTAIMLDVNQFKSINDTYGHSVGDEALIDTANLLCEVVNDMGEVVRYAGDEFVIVLNTQDDYIIQKVLNHIEHAMRRFNETTDKPYALSVSQGMCKLDFSEHGFSEFLDRADRLMYLSKRDFYRQNADRDRRKWSRRSEDRQE